MVEQTCWYCRKNSADRDSAYKVALWNDAGRHQIVEVPRCPACQAVQKQATTAFWILIAAAFLLLIGGFLLGGIPAYRRALALPMGSGNAIILIGLALFFLFGLASFLIGPILRRKAGTRSEGSAHADAPEVTSLKSKGYTRFAPPPAGIEKTCGACGRPVPAGAAPGSRCPHCGAYWSSQKNS